VICAPIPNNFDPLHEGWTQEIWGFANQNLPGYGKTILKKISD
jgi:hypothetical protein